jgi:hypothetical protein
MATSKTGIKSKPLSVSEKLNTINKVNGVPNIPRIRTAEEVAIPVRKVTDKLPGQSDTNENVLRLLKITQIQHTYVISFQELFSPTLFRSYPAE